MFNWLQHLFTARALQAENVQLNLQLSEAKNRINELEKELKVLKNSIGSKNGSRNSFAISDDHPDGH